MSLIEIDRNPSPRQLAVFGVLWMGVFTGLAWSALRGAHPRPAGALLALAGAVPLAGAIRREVLRRVYVGMAVLTAPVGMVVSLLVLATLFYALITPLGLLLRAAGRVPMRRRLDRRTPTYWIARAGDERPERYFQPF